MTSATTSVGYGAKLATFAKDGGDVTRVTAAIKRAADRTGVDFSYLLTKASQESSLNPTAKASTSSATGLYQFTQQTWLQMIKDHGDDYGLGDYAQTITATQSGTLSVADPALRQSILNLRNDPEISAMMAAEYDKVNLETLKTKVGGDIGKTELYLAHFLGAGGASAFLKTMEYRPQAAAADVLPEAAASNPAVFYDKQGNPRSLKDVYQKFAAKFDDALPISASPTRVAQASPMPVSTTSATLAQNDAVSSVQAQTQAMIESTHSLLATMILAQMDHNQFSMDQEAVKKSGYEKNPYAMGINTIYGSLAG